MSFPWRWYPVTRKTWSSDESCSWSAPPQPCPRSSFTRYKRQFVKFYKKKFHNQLLFCYQSGRWIDIKFCLFSSAAKRLLLKDGRRRRPHVGRASPTQHDRHQESARRVSWRFRLGNHNLISYILLKNTLKIFLILTNFLWNRMRHWSVVTLQVEGVAFKKTFSYAGFEMQKKQYEDPKIALLNIELVINNTQDVTVLLQKFQSTVHIFNVPLTHNRNWRLRKITLRFALTTSKSTRKSSTQSGTSSTTSWTAFTNLEQR